MLGYVTCSLVKFTIGFELKLGLDLENLENLKKSWKFEEKKLIFQQFKLGFELKFRSSLELGFELKLGFIFHLWQCFDM